jgi:hypothetical protein
LTALQDDTRVLAAIAQVGAARGWWLSERSWRRTYERFTGAGDPFATLVYQSDAPTQALVKLDVFDGWPSALPRGEAFRLDEALGWIRLMPYYADPALPGLAETLMRPDQATVVRYRPGRRCTLRHEGPDGPRFAKVFATEAGSDLHEVGEALWTHTQRGELTFAVARPDRWDAATWTLWQHPVPGEPIIEALAGPRASDLAFRMGAALGSLGRSSMNPPARFDAADQLRRTRRAARELGQLVPSLAAEVSRMVDELAAFHGGQAARAPRPIHGAPHPSQWLDGPAGLGLVDFDRVAWGDPELDLAVFLAELDYEHGLLHRAEQIETALVAGYEDVAGALDLSLIQVYRAHKRLGKALRAARALRPDGDQRAEDHLRRAFACL